MPYHACLYGCSCVIMIASFRMALGSRGHRLMTRGSARGEAQGAVAFLLLQILGLAPRLAVISRFPAIPASSDFHTMFASSSAARIL